MTKKDIDQNEFPSEKDLDATAEPKDVENTAEATTAETEVETDPQENEIVDKLLDKNQELEKELGASKDQYLRAQAEIQNIKRHSEMEQAALLKYNGQKLATAILPSLDNLERALQAADDAQADSGLVTGVKMVLKHLQQALAENGIEEIKAAGETFDPHVHQAVQTVPATKEHPAETIVEVLQAGYQLKDRVLRPSMVIVAQ
ncbi:nucleotide exchange factor GrpE [Lactobacillus sp. DCY120]|uniref:Protein GrpE n=1 Tax=Bombilactobacillus apium TaxID=2675299 RepID=A0A850R8J1_9LACO|nr:nucleotide exchange factor GrpE [Bombilactobacillus apium]NVY97042.1 nucleotide exchange factor GrpE [Bombilactobacillus apium]